MLDNYGTKVFQTAQWLTTQIDTPIDLALITGSGLGDVINQGRIVKKMGI